jgi:hypothetical protein
MGASRLGRAGPTEVHRDDSSLDCMLTGPVAGGPRGFEEEHIRGGSKPGRNGRPKVNRGQATGVC